MLEKTVCELFAGVGGFRLGLERVGGWQVVFTNQWEPGKKSQHAFNCYLSHFMTGIHTNIDVAEVNAACIPDHTLLVGGFPCQDYSVARTKAEGIIGKKGVLWWQINKILGEKCPPFVLLENVDRLLKSPSKQRGRDFGIILGCLQKLGYAVEWRVINAADYGFPQRRRRVFIFAFKNTTKYYKKLSEVKSMSDWLHKKGFFQEEFPVENSVSTDLTECPIQLKDDIFDISEEFEFAFGNSGTMLNGKIYTEDLKPIYVPETPISKILQTDVDEKYYISEDELPKWIYMKGAKNETRKTKEGYEYIYREGAIPFPDPIDKPSRTMLTSEAEKNRSTHVIRDLQTKRLRLLTPVECERLNGFDDNWTNTDMPQKFRYFCMGNALVVGVIEKIGSSLSKITKTEKSQETLQEKAV